MRRDALTSWILPALAACVLSAAASPAQEADVSGQKKIYREINDGEKSMTKLSATGVFTGIEQGDYAHWQMRESDGTERSFLMLHADASLDRVAMHPEKYEGRPCRVRWERRTEDIPEAGGPMEVDVLLGVEWR